VKRVQTVAAVATVLAIYTAVATVAVGRTDHLRDGLAMFVVFTLGFAFLAWLAISRRSANRALWIPAVASLCTGVAGAGWATAVLVAGAAGFDVSSSGWTRLTPEEVGAVAAVGFALVGPGFVLGVFSMLSFWPLVFPDGVLPSRRWWLLPWVIGTNMAALSAFLLRVEGPGSSIPHRTATSEYSGIGALVDPLYLVLFGLSLLCGASLVSRWRRSIGELRQQYLWVVLGTAALYFVVLVVDENPWALAAALAGVVAAVICYGVAVTKYRLYDIDLVISRTIVYGTLAAFIGAVYVTVVVVVGGMVGAEAGDLSLSVVATAFVAIVFEPLRRVVERWANRLVYGKRATPYEVLSNLTRRLAGAEPAQGVLERMAQLMAEGTGADRAVVWLCEAHGMVAAAGWPEKPSPDRVESIRHLQGASSPVFHDGELVGALEVIKSRGNPVTPPEHRLLTDLAGSAGLVLGNQRLTAELAVRAAELRASRRRLVELGDAERRRLERDLHDGAQQQVVALKLKIAVGEHMARRSGKVALANDLRGLAAETQEAVEEIRRLARGLYPQFLESEDLATAIRSHAGRLAVPVEMTSHGIGRHAKDVESALYFTAVEAMANAVKHGAASRIRIVVSESGKTLGMEIVDDGLGFDPVGCGEGIGLTNVRDRIEALGGALRVSSARGSGTTVSVRLPISEENADVGLNPERHTRVGGTA